LPCSPPSSSQFANSPLPRSRANRIPLQRCDRLRTALSGC
jgi:hypothetical protein